MNPKPPPAKPPERSRRHHPGERFTDSAQGWLYKNTIWVISVIFLTGGLVASWGMHIRTAEAQIEQIMDRQDAALESRAQLARQIALLSQNVATLEKTIDNLRVELIEHRRHSEQVRR